MRNPMNPYKVRLEVHLTQAMNQELLIEAEKTGESKSAVVRRALRKYLAGGFGDILLAHQLIFKE